MEKSTYYGKTWLASISNTIAKNRGIINPDYGIRVTNSQTFLVVSGMNDKHELIEDVSVL